MLTDFDMICHSFPDDINVVPVADVHLGAVECAEKAWEAFLQKVLQSPNTYLILAGDLLNNSTRGVRFANPFEETLRPREAKKRMVEYLEPVKDRVLCLVSGNHEQRTIRDSDQDLSYDICAKLGIEELYRENMAVMRLSLGSRSNRPERPDNSYGVVVTHGSGGGIYTGASLNRDERFGDMFNGIDCLITGHVHKGFMSAPAKINVDLKNAKVTMSCYTVISCVSWLEYGGYSARGMLKPALTKKPQSITFKRGHVGGGKGMDLNWHVC